MAFPFTAGDGRVGIGIHTTVLHAVGPLDTPSRIADDALFLNAFFKSGFMGLVHNRAMNEQAVCHCLHSQIQELSLIHISEPTRPY